MKHYTYTVRTEANAVVAYDSHGEFVGEARIWVDASAQTLGVRDAVGVLGWWERTNVLEPWHHAGIARPRPLPTWADEALARLGLVG